MNATNEIDIYKGSTLPAKLEYAKVLADSGLLPAAYRRNPANVLWAVEYGEMLGLPPMAAMTGVHVIEGKPTASAGLISGLVRRAGHKLRVWGDSKSATCQIVRSDDPGYTFEVTWTLRKEPGDNPSAEEAGLLGKNIWKNYPASMLKARAITQCARDACEEVLYGLHYTPEELGAEVDEDGVSSSGAASPRGGRAQKRRMTRPSARREHLARRGTGRPRNTRLDACGSCGVSPRRRCARASWPGHATAPGAPPQARMEALEAATQDAAMPRETDAAASRRA